MYTIYDIDDAKTHENAVVFRFNGQKMVVDNGLKAVEIPREELDALIAWLRCGLEKIDRDVWNEEHKKTCSCHGVNVANE